MEEQDESGYEGGGNEASPNATEPANVEIGKDMPDTEQEGSVNSGQRERPVYKRTESYWNGLQGQYCCHRNVFCRTVPDMMLEYEFPWYRQLLLVGVGLFYFIDIGLDAFVAATYFESYYNSRDPSALNYFIATVCFIVLPNFLIQVVSWFLYFWSYYLNHNQGPIALRKRFLTFHRHHNSSSHMVAMACHNQDCTEHKEVLQCASAPARVRNRWSARSASQSPHTHIVGSDQESPATLRTTLLSPSSSQGRLNPEDGSVQNAASVQSDTVSSSGGRVQVRLDDSTAHFVKGESPGRESVDFGGPKFQPLDYNSNKGFCVISIFHLLFLGFPVRIGRLLWYSSVDPFTYFRYRDVSFIRLMEAFLEAAPQAILQLYLMQIQEETVLFYKIITPISIVSSVVTLAFAVADFASAGKDILAFIPISVGSGTCPIAQNDLQLERMTWTAYFVYILWQLFMISARVLTLSFFAAEYGGYVFIILGVHYVIMILWMYHQTGNVFQLSENRSGQPKCGIFNRYLIEFIAAAFNIFFYFSLLDNDEEEEHRGKALAHSLFYNILIFLENILMAVLWYIAVDFSVWYAHPGLVAVVLCYAIGAGFMASYFCVLSPKKVALQRQIQREFPCTSSHHKSNGNRVKRFTSTLNWFFNYDEVFRQIRKNQTVLY